MTNEQKAKYYFANLGADLARCVCALKNSDKAKFKSLLDMARNTLELIRQTKRYEAYEEGLLLIRAMEYARKSNSLDIFNKNLNKIISIYLPVFNA